MKVILRGTRKSGEDYWDKESFFIGDFKANVHILNGGVSITINGLKLSEKFKEVFD